MRIWTDKNERILLLIILGDLLALVLVESEFSLHASLANTSIGDFLTSESIKSICSRILISLLSAYVFYLLINFMPRVRRERKTYKVLNSMVASVLDAFKRSRWFGHETPIDSVDLGVLNEEWISSTISEIKENKVSFFQLKFATQTAHSRLEDFRHSLPLAVALAPEHAERWLVLTDKIRLLAENYEQQPEVPEDKLSLIDKETDDNPIRLYRGDLKMRFLEVLEQSKQWLSLSPYNNG